jgi:P-type Cu2+ transporter
MESHQHSREHQAPQHPEAAGQHQQHSSSDHVGQFRRLFWVMLFVGIPVIAFSDSFAMLVGYHPPTNLAISLVPPVLGTLMFVWGGRPFLLGALAELKRLQPGMMLLISLAISVAYLASLGASLGIFVRELDFWWELALLIVIMLLGHWIEMRSLAQTTSALDSLAALLPDEAEVVSGEEITRMSPSNLKLGDMVVVRPGGRVPADGQITSGLASMDESMITGESGSVQRGVGE